MKLYAAVRLMRGVTLGALTGTPAAALVTETASFVPLYRNLSATAAGMLALFYSSDMAGSTLELLEEPMRRSLQLEAVFLTLSLLYILARK